MQLTKQRFIAASHAMLQFCEVKQIPYSQRITIYKSVIRSQLEYAGQIIFYDDQQFRDINRLQLYTLRKLLHIPYSTPDALVYLTTNILPLEHRFHQLQLNFFSKLRMSRSTLPGTILSHILTTPSSLKPDPDTAISYKHSIQSVIRTYGESLYTTLYYPYQSLDHNIYKDIIKLKIHQYCTLEQLQSLRSTNPDMSTFCTHLLNIPNSDFLEYHNTPEELTHNFDQMISDFPFNNICKPTIQKRYIPHELQFHIQHIWAYTLWHLTATTQNNQFTCSHCHETYRDPLLHYTFKVLKNVEKL